MHQNLTISKACLLGCALALMVFVPGGTMRLGDSRTIELSSSGKPFLGRIERPAAIANVPSVFDYKWSDDKIVLSSARTSVQLPFASSTRDLENRLEASKTLTEDLVADLDRQRLNVRDDYRRELQRYASRLPVTGDDRSILLADASIRTLRELFAAEVDILPVSLAARLKTILEQHIGLRPFYPEVEVFYRDVRSGRLTEPLPLDAIDGVIRAVKEHTPSIFDESVVKAIDESAERSAIVGREESAPRTVRDLQPPPDPIGTLDPQKANDFQVAGVINKLWKVFTEGETIHSAAEAWKSTYDSLAPAVGQVLVWLAQFLGIS